VVRVDGGRRAVRRRFAGRGDEKAADQAAVDAMRNALNSLDIDGTIVIGEGGTGSGADAAQIGEKVGSGRWLKGQRGVGSLRGHHHHRCRR
jgi:fructose-1,6-bisphosphatase II / sedoheptulose-1,7-bisphosphatase